MGAPKGVWKLLKWEDIAAFREKQGIKSDAELAERLEVSTGSIAGWKKGVRAPSLRVQGELVRAIESAAAPKGVSPDTRRLVKRLLALAPQVEDSSALVDASVALLRAS